MYSVDCVSSGTYCSASHNMASALGAVARPGGLLLCELVSGGQLSQGIDRSLSRGLGPKDDVCRLLICNGEDSPHKMCPINCAWLLTRLASKLFI